MEIENNMKKLTVIAVVLCLVLALASAATVNDQKIYSVDSEVYRSITKLYLASGRAVPSTTGPWSGAELKAMVDTVERDSLPQYLQETYDEVVSELDEEGEIVFKGGEMNISGAVNLDIYAHTYSGDISRTDSNGIKETAFAGRSSWYGKDLTKNNPFFTVDWETKLGNGFYTYFNAYLSNSVRGEKEIGSTNLNSNIPALQNFSLDVKMLDINFPSRAFVAVGGDGWSIQIGRDRLSWGSGLTGNLVLSDNFPYHDMVRATAYTDSFKYTYLVSFFPNKMNYYSWAKDENGKDVLDENGNKVIKYQGNNDNDSTRILNGISFYAAHRFEGRFFSDRLSVAFTEAIMYESQSSSVQFAALSPMYFMHNAYMPSNSNSTLGLEINWTPLNGLGIYAQILIDQFAMPGFETAPGPGKSKKTTTDGKAFLLGAKYLTSVGEGTLTVNGEAVYVMPYTYLRDGSNGYGLDYTGAVKYRLYSYEDYAGHTDILYDEYIIGYTYGPDSLVGCLSASWEKDRLTVGGKFLFIAHGTHDIWTKWTKVPANTSEDVYKAENSGLTTDHDNTTNYRYNDVSSRNSISYTYDIGLSASYELLDNLTLDLTLDYVAARNIYNVKGQNASDFQVILGVSYRPF